MTTGAFSRNVGKLFSELKLVTDNLLSIYKQMELEKEIDTVNSWYTHSILPLKMAAHIKHLRQKSVATPIANGLYIAMGFPRCKVIIKANLRSAMGNYVYFRNDTDFEVKIFDYDTNRTLYPGETEKNGLAKGPYYVELLMKFLTYDSDRKRFESSKFEGQTEFMSRLFGKEIEEYREKERRKEEKSKYSYT